MIFERGFLKLVISDSVIQIFINSISGNLLSNVTLDWSQMMNGKLRVSMHQNGMGSRGQIKKGPAKIVLGAGHGRKIER